MRPCAYGGRVKEFVIYTLLRLGLFAASFAVIAGIWLLVTGGDLPIFPPLIVAFLVSGVASWFLLDRQRQAFASRVDSRAQKASKALQKRRSREDRE